MKDADGIFLGVKRLREGLALWFVECRLMILFGLTNVGRAHAKEAKSAAFGSKANSPTRECVLSSTIFLYFTLRIAY